MDLITLALAKKYVNKKFAEAVSFGGFQIIDTLPVENISATTVYLLKSKSETEGNVYEEYIYTNGKWESLGTTVDLAGYVTEENLQAAINTALQQAKENGDFKPVKGEDYWTEEDKQEIIDEVVAQMPEPEAGGMTYVAHNVSIDAIGEWHYASVFNNKRIMLDMNYSKRIAISEDGYEWKTFPLDIDATSEIIKVAQSSDTLIAITKEQNIYISSNGLAWEKKTFNYYVVDGEDEYWSRFSDIVYFNDTFIISLTHNGFNVLTSKDNGKTWSEIIINSNTGDWPLIDAMLLLDNGLYLMCDSDSWYSLNVHLYYCKTLDETATYIGEIPGRLTGKVNNAYYANVVAYTSTDLLNWTFTDMISDGYDWYSVAYLDNAVAAVGIDRMGTVKTFCVNTDGTENWINIPFNFEEHSHCSLLSTTKEFIFTNFNDNNKPLTIAVSENGIDWTTGVFKGILQDNQNITNDVKEAILNDFHRLEYQQKVSVFDGFESASNGRSLAGMVKGTVVTNNIEHSRYVLVDNYVDGSYTVRGEIFYSDDGLVWKNTHAKEQEWSAPVWNGEVFATVCATGVGEGGGTQYYPTLALSYEGKDWLYFDLPYTGSSTEWDQIMASWNAFYIASSQGNTVLIVRFNTDTQEITIQQHTFTEVETIDYFNQSYWSDGMWTPWIVRSGSQCYVYNTNFSLYQQISLPENVINFKEEREMLYVITNDNKLYSKWYDSADWGVIPLPSNVTPLSFTEYPVWYEYTDVDDNYYSGYALRMAIACKTGIFVIYNNTLYTPKADLNALYLYLLCDENKLILTGLEGDYWWHGTWLNLVSEDYGAHWSSQKQSLEQGPNNEVTKGVAEALWPHIDVKVTQAILAALGAEEGETLLDRIEQVEKASTWGEF